MLIVLLFTSSLLSSTHAASVIKNIRQVQRQSCASGPQTNYPPECADYNGIKEWTLENFFGVFICNSSSPCGSLLLSYLRTRCLEEHDRYLADYYELQCRVNADGIPCYRFHNSTFNRDFNETAALQKCKSSIQVEEVCSEKCKNQLEAISNVFGSCASYIYNNSYFHFVGVDIVSLFSYQLWRACGVPIPSGASSIQTVAFTNWLAGMTIIALLVAIYYYASSYLSTIM